MTPETENALIALAVTTCREHREVADVIVCDLSAHHDGPVHYDPVDGVFWIPAQRGMTRDQAETVARRIREAMAA